jgi:hypothetical protein
LNATTPRTGTAFECETLGEDRYAELRQALDQIAGGCFSVDAPDRFRPVIDALTTNHNHRLDVPQAAAGIAPRE